MIVKLLINLSAESDFRFNEDDLILGTEIFIGREDDCHIILDDKKISRYHAKVVVEKDGLYIEKISTTGELFLNGISVDKSILSNGDTVRIDDFSLIFNELPLDIANSSYSYTEKIKMLPEDDIPEAQGQKTDIITEKFEAVEDEAKEEPFDEEASAEENLSDSFEEFSDSVIKEEPSLEKEEETFNSEGEDFSSPEPENDSFEDNFSNEDGSAFEDGFSDDSDSFDESGDSTQVFKSFANFSLKLFGEYAPYDRFLIEDKEIFIGRDPEKCKIVLDDPEVSSVHAVIRKNLINCTIEDLNSSNGTILNGERINKEELKSNDEFLIGSTSFTVEISNELLESEGDRLMPVDRNQEVEVEEIVEEEVDFNELSPDGGDFSVEGAPKEKSFIKRILKDKKKRPIVIVVVILLLYVLFDSDDEPAKKEVKKGKETVEQVKAPETENVKKELPPEILEKLEQNYVLALSRYDAGAYFEAKEYLDTIVAIDPNYKDTQTLVGLVKQGYEELTRLKEEEQREKERRALQLEIEKLVKKAQAATKDKNVTVAESLFSQILEKDPENIDVPQMRLEIDAYKKAEEEKKLEAERLKAKRQKMVDLLAPGKALYLREEWFQAIIQLDKFVKAEGIDEDLLSEATNMINESKVNLSKMLNPLLGKARSFKEGQDLKNAYQVYGDILKIDPTNEEALDEREEIKEILEGRSKKLYRDALISESLSLFEEAKEKLQEVQQISPTDSEYYEKATEKLKDYLE